MSAERVLVNKSWKREAAARKRAQVDYIGRDGRKQDTLDEVMG